MLASLVSDDEDPDKFIWLEFWDLATPPTVKEEGKVSDGDSRQSNHLSYDLKRKHVEMHQK